MKKTTSKIFSHDKIDIGYNDLVSKTTTNGRAYTLPNGSSYPSVTTVLSILTEDSIRSWRNRIGEEAADIIEILKFIYSRMGFYELQIEAAGISKYARKGGFQKNYILEWVKE